MIVAIVGMGMMGSAVGARLVAGGVVVRTSLAGRSPSSAQRARVAGIELLDDDRTLVDGASVVLSIVPPDAALGVARRIAPALAAVAAPPTFVDCNAVSPSTLEAVHATVRAAGAPFVDAAIFGIPPKASGSGPRFGVCGDATAAALALRDHGLDVVDLDAPVGAASALKMCTGALTKGLTALGVAVNRGAAAAGVSELFHAEMRRSQPELTVWLDRQLPGVETKAQRWGAELDENAAFFDDAERGAPVFAAIGAFYRLVAERRVESIG